MKNPDRIKDEDGPGDNPGLSDDVCLLLEALDECEYYFEQRADADWDAEDGFIPNKEMRMLSVVRAAIARADGR